MIIHQFMLMRCNQSWNFETAQTPGRERVLESEFNHVVSDSVNYVYIMKPEKSILYAKAPWNFPVAEHFDVLEQRWTMIPMKSHGKRAWKL